MLRSSRRASTTSRMPASSSLRLALMWMPSLPKSMRSSSAPSFGPTSPKAPAASLAAAHLLSQQHRNENHDRSLQRSVPLYRQLCSLHHGRGHSEPQRQRQVHRLQRGQSSYRAAATGSTSANRIGRPPDG